MDEYQVGSFVPQGWKNSENQINVDKSFSTQLIKPANRIKTKWINSTTEGKYCIVLTSAMTCITLVLLIISYIYNHNQQKFPVVEGVVLNIDYIAKDDYPDPFARTRKPRYSVREVKNGYVAYTYHKMWGINPFGKALVEDKNDSMPVTKFLEQNRPLCPCE